MKTLVILIMELYMSICMECGRRFDKSKPFNGHDNTCNTGIQEEEWIERGLSEHEQAYGWGLWFDADGRPYLYDKEEEEAESFYSN